VQFRTKDKETSVGKRYDMVEQAEDSPGGLNLSVDPNRPAIDSDTIVNNCYIKYVGGVNIVLTTGAKFLV
jgi:hypothetical protein